MMARNFDLQNQNFRTHDQALTLIDWTQLDKALAVGVVGTRTPTLGRAVTSIVDEHPCPSCVYQVMIPFRQDSGNQWRWLGVVYPGD
jgi:hypothetical protein